MQKAGRLSPEAAWHAVPAAHTFGLPKHSAPKVLSDIIESLIGAVFIDSGCSLDATWAVAHRLLAPLAPLGKTPMHPKRELHVSVPPVNSPKLCRLEVHVCSGLAGWLASRYQQAT